MRVLLRNFSQYHIQILQDGQLVDYRRNINPVTFSNVKMWMSVYNNGPPNEPNIDGQIRNYVFKKSCKKSYDLN